MDIRAATSGIALKCTSETPCLNSQHSEPSTAAQGLFLKPGEVVLFGKDSSCPLPLHEGISQLQTGVWLARGGSQVIQHGHCHLCGQRWQVGRSCCFSFPFILFSECTDESRFSAPQPRGGNPAGKAQAVPCASAARGGQGCLRRACWLLIASEKAASGGPSTPSAAIQLLKLLSACFGNFLCWWGLPGSY